MLNGGWLRRRGGCAVKVRDLTRGDLLWSRVTSAGGARRLQASRTERGGRLGQGSAEAIVPVSSVSLRWEGPNVVEGAVRRDAQTARGESSQA